MQPREPNQLTLDPAIFKHYGDQIEVERAHTLADRPGRLRLLAFRSRAVMSRYQDAIDLATQTAGAPDLNAVRFTEQIKYGFGINLEQNLSDSAGIFARVSWADGATETYAFTEIDRSVSGGLLLRGGGWGRTADSIGIAAARNGISAAHRNYLAAGGLGFFLGDGALRYRPEDILESFYSFKLARELSVSADFQRVFNPGYNADRGPVNVISARLHYGF
jgi:carbohydrate-selective porin OprB